jgi:5-methyltetrahydrofolate--homocysteine methyltransferase
MRFQNTMGIVNPNVIGYDETKDLLEHVEDVILDRRDDATERLLDFAEMGIGSKTNERF